MRVPLELDKPFLRSSYSNPWNAWRKHDVEDFSRGPVAWLELEKPLGSMTSAAVLRTVRHAVAHSNVYFGGEGEDIDHIYFGNRTEQDEMTDKYKVVRGTLADVTRMISSWLDNVGRLRATSALVLQALDEAA